MSCQCRDFPQSYVVIPLALATRNLFHNFLSSRSSSSLDTYLLLKLINFNNILVGIRVTEFWKINHFIAHETIRIFMFNMVYLLAETTAQIFLKLVF